MKRIKRTFTQEEKELVYDLWKQGAGFSDIGRVIEAQPGSVFTILRETGGIKPRQRTRNVAHLTSEEREEIRAGLSAKMSIRAIARLLERPPSTISREVSRNRGRRYYKAIDADRRARRMAKRPKLGALEINLELKQIVIEKLHLKWSPEQISGWLKVEYSRQKRMHVSHETIYKSLYVRSRKIIHHSFTEYLRRKHPMRHSRFHSRSGDRGFINIINGVSIHERSKNIDNRKSLGHWEGDLVSGSGNTHIATLVDRKSRFTIILKLAGKDAESVHQALLTTFREMPSEYRKSLTWDRGMELAKHADLTEEIGYKKRRHMNSGPPATVAPNLLERQFDVEGPNRAWVTDITYIRTYEGWLYLAVVLDLFSRQIIGWSMHSRMEADLVIRALLMAVWKRKPESEVIVHSDQGSQYTSHEWQSFLKVNNLKSSMSRRGNCHDNAVAESFFQLLKRERIKRKIYATRDLARQDIFDYIEMFYNPVRKHGSNDMLSPIEYEKRYFMKLGVV